MLGWSVIALFLAATYPLTKRFLAIPQAYLGIAFGFGIPMAFVAQHGVVPPIAWQLLLANVFWVQARVPVDLVEFLDAGDGALAVDAGVGQIGRAHV